MHADMERLEGKIDKLSTDVTELRVMLEHRVTKIEVKAGVLGVVAGAIGGWFSALKGG